MTSAHGPELTTERLHLRRWRTHDREPFAALNADPRVMEHFPGGLSAIQSRDLIRRIEEHFDEYGFGLWAVARKDTGLFIGFTGLKVPEFEAHFTPCVEVAWRLAFEQWGRGYATEAARAAVDFAFGELALDEVVAFTVPANLRSRAVMQRLGMDLDDPRGFEHPALPVGHPLRRHVLYRLARPRGAATHGTQGGLTAGEGLAHDHAMQIELPLLIERQPDYTTCGPTSLHSVYRFLGDDISLQQVIDEVPKNPGGGTLNVHLAVHALRRGYEAEIYAFGLHIIDPTWFQGPVDIPAKVRARFEVRGQMQDPKIAHALASIDEFHARGGRYRFEDLTPELITGFLSRRMPLLTGTNATYLYNCARETDDRPDDVGGDAMGHFVVVCGYDSNDHTVRIADPLQDNPAFGMSYYRVSIHRLIGAIFLGASTYDANFMVLRPGPQLRP